MSEDATVDYSDNQEFNDDFDSYTSEIKIGNLPPYKTSYVLYSVDYEAYLQAVREYAQNKEEENKALILSSYPQPISYYFHQSEKGYSNHNHRLQLLRSTWEAIIFTLYAIVMGEARSKNFPLRDIAVLKPDGTHDLSFSDYFSDRLAQKLQIIERILVYSHDHHISLLCNNIIPLPVIQKIKSLNQARNGFMHIAAISESQAASKYSELHSEVFEVLTDLSELSSLSLLRYMENAGSVTALRCEVFRGFSLARDVPTIQITPSQLSAIANELNDQNILAIYQDNMFSVTPFYHFSIDANGHRTNLCYCKRRQSATKYEYEIVTQSQLYEIDGAVFVDRINELRGLIL